MTCLVIWNEKCIKKMNRNCFHIKCDYPKYTITHSHHPVPVTNQVTMTWEFLLWSAEMHKLLVSLAGTWKMIVFWPETCSLMSYTFRPSSEHFMRLTFGLVCFFEKLENICLVWKAEKTRLGGLLSCYFAFSNPKSSLFGSFVLF